MTTKPPSRTAEQFIVRFPDGMRDKIADSAKSNGRSMNAEIVHRLEQSLTPTAFLKQLATDELMNEILSRLDTQTSMVFQRVGRANRDTK